MYVKTVIIDGFKSYRDRVEIKNFDPLFTAITGENGTGKSNILDAICFVLGISATQVRATDTQGLIYKNGQAEVKKASVTIIFDNSDKNNSPAGCESYNEITITKEILSVPTCKTRYLVNGTCVVHKRVTDLFSSVRLNVNNPHFLIMQGRISKILSMKPHEILGMVEETVGTSIYDGRKAFAEKTIQKKEPKLTEAGRVMEENIKPTFNRMKEQKEETLQLQKLEQEFSHKTKLFVAYKYMKTEENLIMVTQQYNEFSKQTKEMQQKIEGMNKEMEMLEKQKEKVEKKISEESGGVLKKLEAQLKSKEQEESSQQVLLKSADNDIATEQRNIEQLRKHIIEDEKTLVEKEQIFYASRELGSLKEREANLVSELEAARQRYHAASSGLLPTEDGTGNATLSDQLNAAQKNLSEAQTTRLNSETEKVQRKNLLETVKTQMMESKKELSEVENELQKVDEVIRKEIKELEKMNYKKGTMEALTQKRDDLQSQIKQLEGAMESLERENWRLKFTYMDPEPNFDRSSVRGVVAKLFRCIDNHFLRAIEAVAGQRLYNVVVNHDGISKKLIAKGRLKFRTTFVPLNQIHGYVMRNDIIQRAKRKVGENNVIHAMTVVQSDNEYRAVLEWLFGDVLICATNDIAHDLAYDQTISKKCVTLDGDIYIPSGIVHGSGPVNKELVLRQVERSEQVKHQLRDNHQELQNVEKQIVAIKSVAERYATCVQEINLKEYKASLLRKRLEQSTYRQKQREVETLEQEIKSLEETIVRCLKDEQKLAKRIKDIKDKSKDAEKLQEKAKASAKKDMEKYQKALDSVRVQLQGEAQDFDMMRVDIEEQRKSIQEAKGQLQENINALDRMLQNRSNLVKAYEAVQNDINQLKANRDAEKQRCGEHSGEIMDIVKRKKLLDKHSEEMKLDLMSRANEEKKLKHSIENNEAFLEETKNRNPWIQEERRHFGKENSGFDFRKYNMEAMGVELTKLKQNVEELKRKVPKKRIDVSFQREEERFSGLLYRRETVDKDRRVLFNTMRKLDQKRDEIIKIAWRRINKDFGDIFGALLPGGYAELRPISRDADLSLGLQIHVSLTEDKASKPLDELSGGQRSLVALAFIFAMLRYQPAPIYILDEVDAALDVSHTENIGRLLKTHFKNSQFIIVSLKQGMFKNANVIFRTHFTNGMSGVIRDDNR